MKLMPTMLIVAVSLSVSSPMPVSASVADGVRQLNFDVFLDDREIGFQRFTLTPTDNGKRIETEAKFEVKFLRITVFAYDHRNTKEWRDGCLQTIDARTNSNNKKQTEEVKKQNEDLKKKYAVQGFPTFVLVDADGKELGRQVGYLKGGPSSFVTKIEEWKNSATK